MGYFLSLQDAATIRNSARPRDWRDACFPEFRTHCHSMCTLLAPPQAFLSTVLLPCHPVSYGEPLSFSFLKIQGGLGVYVQLGNPFSCVLSGWVLFGQAIIVSSLPQVTLDTYQTIARQNLPPSFFLLPSPCSSPWPRVSTPAV